MAALCYDSTIYPSVLLLQDRLVYFRIKLLVLVLGREKASPAPPEAVRLEMLVLRMPQGGILLTR